MSNGEIVENIQFLRADVRDCRVDHVKELIRKIIIEVNMYRKQKKVWRHLPYMRNKRKRMWIWRKKMLRMIFVYQWLLKVCVWVLLEVKRGFLIMVSRNASRNCF